MSDRWGAEPWAVPGSAADAEDAPERPAPQARPPASAGSPAAPPPPSPAAARGPSHPDHAVATASVAALAATPPRTASGDGETPPQLALRRMTVADILDGAFTVIKARPARILGIAAAFVVPVHVLAAYAQRDAFGGVGLWEAWWSEDPAVTAVGEARASGLDAWSTLMTWLVPAIALVFVAAAIAHLVGSWTMGRDVTGADLLAVTARRSWALLASFVLVHVLEALGAVALYVGAGFVMAFFVATAPAIGAEGLGPLAAMRRSASLARRRYWRTLGISLLIGLVSSVLFNALAALPELIALLIGFDVAWSLAAAGNILGGVVTTPFVAAATVLLYLDLRIRTEGLDLVLASREAFRGRVDGGVEHG